MKQGRPPKTCGLCGERTPLGDTTKRCDRCWELEKSVKAHPSIARMVLARLDHEDSLPIATSPFCHPSRRQSAEEALSCLI